jgi:membrane protease YdiL (CAAX protease family)
MNKVILLLCLFLITSNSNAQTVDTTSLQKPTRLPLWTVALPGASYYYQRQYVMGTIFATLEVGGIYAGIKYNQKLKSNSITPYYNYPKSIGLQAMYVEKIANFKNHLERFKYRNPDFEYDTRSEKELYLAPFKKENVFTPITGVMVLFSGATLGVSLYLQEQGISDVEEMSFLDKYIPRNQALALYCPIGFAQGWGAGIAEEYRYRNWLMPLLDYKYGQKKGLVFSSLAFGVSHATNFIFEKHPDYKLAIFQIAGTSLAGLVYGWDVHRRDYNIGPVVAAHMWFDTLLMVGSFLINPETNYLGISLKFDMQ